MPVEVDYGSAFEFLPAGPGIEVLADQPEIMRVRMVKCRDIEQRFGLPAATVLHKEAERGAAPQEMATLALKITSLSFGAGGRVVIGLENGQVWQQLTPSSDLELLKLGDRVEISRGLLGSFWLSGPGKRGAKVTRVR